MTAVPDPTDDRTFQRFDRTYSTYGVRHLLNLAPVDTEEEVRLRRFEDTVYHLRDQAYLPEPLHDSDDNESDIGPVLDCGFGFGAWIDRLLEEHDDTEVTGVDIIFFEPTNAEAFELYEQIRWNLNSSLRSSGLRPESFKLINMSCLAEGISVARWPTLLGQLKVLLQPGGYVQMMEPHYLFQSDAGRTDAFPRLQQWWNMYKANLRARDRDPDIGPQLQHLLRRARFEDIETVVLTAPIGDWRHPVLGERIRANLLEMIHSWSLYPLVALGGGSVTEAIIEQLVDRIKVETSDASLKLYYRIYIAWGRKP